MEAVDIYHNSHRIWKVSAAIYGLSLACGLILISLGWILGEAPDAFDCVGLVLLPLSMAGSWLAFVWGTRRNSATQLSVNDEQLAIRRHGGEEIRLPWATVKAIEYSDAHSTAISLRVETDRIKVWWYEFAGCEWEKWHTAIVEDAPPHVERIDTSLEGANWQGRVWDRLSIGLLVVGGPGVAGLMLWNINNAAWLILAPGIAVALIFLGHMRQDTVSAAVATRIGFYAQKILGLLPLAVLGYALATPAGWLNVLSNTVFFAAVATMLTVHGGWSVQQYACGPLRGVNRYQRGAFRVAMAVCILGFALKCWNEG
ncbi:MAG: hypothetical protein ACI8W8_004014 [Rhodothermales bacterium]|jgi:hypothetical protein